MRAILAMLTLIWPIRWAPMPDGLRRVATPTVEGQQARHQTAESQPLPPQRAALVHRDEELQDLRLRLQLLEHLEALGASVGQTLRCVTHRVA